MMRKVVVGITIALMVVVALVGFWWSTPALWKANDAIQQPELTRELRPAIQ